MAEVNPFSLLSRPAIFYLGKVTSRTDIDLKNFRIDTVEHFFCRSFEINDEISPRVPWSLANTHVFAACFNVLLLKVGKKTNPGCVEPNRSKNSSSNFNSTVFTWL
jgi:hypothetical protein